MKPRIVLSLAIFLAMSMVSLAQNPQSDAENDHLKGNVKTVLTTVRTPQGRVVGQPVRNFFNRDGYYIQNTYYDTLGNPVIVVKYEYGKKNKLVKDTRTLEPFSELMSQTLYSYDKKSRAMIASLYDINDSLQGTTVYNYDKYNAVTKVTTYDEHNNELAATTYDYNEFGLQTYATFTEGPNHLYRGGEKYRYDTDGHLAEQCSYYLTTLRQAFLYTYYYDDNGNWIQAYVYHVSPSEGYLYQVITRQITYYED